MALQFDPRTGKITYRGKKVGEHIFKDGRSIVRLNIEPATPSLPGTHGMEFDCSRMNSSAVRASES